MFPFDDVIMDSNADYDDRIVDCYEAGGIYRLFLEVYDFRKRFPSNFVFAHVNLNSLRHKYAFIRDMLNKTSLDYIALAESKLDASFSNAQFEVPGYTIHRQDFTHSSDGLFIYVRSDIPRRRLFNIEINENGFESLSIEFSIGKVKNTISCIYKHPKVSNELFKSYFSKMCDSSLLSWDVMILFSLAIRTVVLQLKSDTIQYICDLYGLTNLVIQSTCYKGDTGRIRLSVSTVNRTYGLTGITHVTPFRKYGKHSTGPSTYGSWAHTYSKLFSCKSALTLCSYRAQTNEICT